MTATEAEFLRTLRATFKVEAAEHLQAIGTGLLELEKAPVPAEQLQLIETVFRAAHSLKGAARAVGFTDVESFCQSLEDLFASWKRHESLPTPAALDAAHRTVDKMSQAIAEPAAANRIVRGTQAASAAAASQRTQAAATAHPLSPPLTGESETVRVAVSSLDARLLEAEEMLAAKLAAGQRAADLGALAGRFEQWHKEWSRVEPQAQMLRQAMERPAEAASGPDLSGLAEFFTWNHDYLRALGGAVTALQRTAEQDRVLVGKLVDDLLENSKKLLMLPLATLSALLAKLVRDLCRDQGKEAELVIRGEEVTIDKRILEELKDPLIHLLRNCIDHGIETPEQRRRAGKPPRATITLEVSRVNGNQVEISLSDDGAGIDIEKVKEAAVKRGLVVPDTSEQLSQSAALALVFEADVSTSPMITQVSGRGLGLAIVREKAEKLGGRVAIESRRGCGTTIRMTLPLTLATFRGVLVEAAQRLFIIPTAQVERAVRFKSQEVQTVEGRRTLALNGRAVALADLAEVLQLPSMRPKADRPEATPGLVLGAGEQRVAFAVDAILDEREVLVKRLAKPLSRVRNIAGATVLGSGQLAPILNVPDLLKSARIAGAALLTPAPAQLSAAPARRILVAEDSITSRVLLKGILESAGYRVKTAVDGIEAYTTLRAESFDLLVSDVEMPRMNGFDLTARVRADRTLAELPVVLVTALESREDRERGIDVGANAYLVKSSLDQSNLLEAVRRLA
jgi:two-component system, chemotaxis family, sensor kinase CheA